VADRQLEPALATLGLEVRLVFALFLSVFVLTSAGFDTSEASFDYAVAHQIWTQGTLGFSQPREGIFTVAPNGRTYAAHEFGNALFLLPVAGVNVVLEKALADRYDPRRIGLITGFAESMMPVIYCASTIALFYAMLRISFKKSIATALSSSMAFAFCTFVWTYSRNLFDGVLCMCLLTGAMLSALEFRRTMKLRYFVIAMVLCGLGFVTRLTMALSLAAFAIYLTMAFWRDFKRLARLAAIGLAVLAPFGLWQGYYNHLRTGHWLLSPVLSGRYASSNGLTGSLALGLTGLLFSPGKSIFLYVPLALLSIVCFRRFAAKHPSEAAFVASLSVLWLAVHSKMASNWYGAWGWGPRHFITIAPVLALPACAEWEWMQRNVWRRMMMKGALTWGAVLSVSSIIGNWQFRMALGYAEGRHDNDVLLWSPTGGQALDMISGAISNLRNIALRTPIPTLFPFSPVNCYASNTINVWMNSAAYAGVPRILLATAGMAFLAVAGYCAMALRQILRQDLDEARGLGGLAT
jgi:hypothetical protein